MNSNPFDLDDPRLTAYVLGELDAGDRSEIEQQIADHEAVRFAVDEIRQTAELLKTSLQAEPKLSLTQSQREAIEQEASQLVLAVPAARPKRRRLWAVLASGAAIAIAVCFLPIMRQAREAPTPTATRHQLLARSDEAPAGRYVDSMDAFDSSTANIRNAVVVGVEDRRQPTNKPGGTSRYLTELAERDLGNPTNPVEVIRRGYRDSLDGTHPTDGAARAGAKSGEPQIAQRHSAESKPRLSFGVGVGDGKAGVAGTPGSSQPVEESREVALRLEQAEPLPPTGPALGGRSRTGNAASREDYAKRVNSTAQGQPSGPASTAPAAGTGFFLSAKPHQDSRPAAEPVQVAAQPAIRPNFSRDPAPVTWHAPTAQPAEPNSSGKPVPPVGDTTVRLEAESKFANLSPQEVARLKSEVTTAVTRLGVAPADAEKLVSELELRRRTTLERESAEPAPGNESYEPIFENSFVSPVNEPLSTFSIDVDTASYANVRRFLNQGQWPPANAVRIEELINYFHYDYPQPEGEHPFSVNIEVGTCPWQTEHRLVRIGLKGREIPREQRSPSNLVFLIDVSGSMRDQNKLPLVKSALNLLVEQMTEDDRIAIVTYANNAGLLLDSTTGTDKATILSAINNLNAAGSTNGAAGLQTAYDTATKHFVDKGTNRIILCTDGDFNVGISSDDELVSLIQTKAESRVFLSIFGFGMGNLKDAKLEKLADKGNGHYGYVDSLREAQKVFVEELSGTLITIAKDVKLQIEFNPSQVGLYRLIGYENRTLTAQEFNDDAKDAGEIGAGHSVTALYEIVPPGKLSQITVDPLKYQRQPGQTAAVEDKVAASSNELLTLKLRYKQPEGDTSVRVEFPATDSVARKEPPSAEFEWAAAVASFGLILRNSQYRGDADFDHVLELAAGSQGQDESGYRREFIELVKAARVLRTGK